MLVCAVRLTGFVMRRSQENAMEDAGRVRRRDRGLAWGFTAGVHLIVFGALLWPRTASPPAKPALAPMIVSILPKPPGPPDREPGGSGEAIEPTMVQPRMPAAVPVTITVADNSDLLSESQIAGAASVGEGGGGGGGGCDLAWAVQKALRRDRLVHTAVEGANRTGKAVMMWNGDWVRSGGQDGKGLSAVREAIMWAVAFAPESCRNERMREPVLISLADGRTRFAIGSGDWRWSDLLGLRKVR
ncbi:MAG: hypothetical protein ABI608_08015 [Rhizomicrobium sp.]